MSAGWVAVGCYMLLGAGLLLVMAGVDYVLTLWRERGQK